MSRSEMALQRLMSLAFLVMGCQFDSSTTAIGADVDAGSGGFSTCASFEPEPCGECGILRCSEGAEGTRIECSGSGDRGSCAANEVCDLQGQCEPAGATSECQPGQVRPCGECAEESCVSGQWSGQCEPKHDRCGNGAHCLEVDATHYTCQISCSTVGHRSPCVDDDGSSEPIPDFVSPGTFWFSQDSCEVGSGCQDCGCFQNFSGNTFVQCDFRCDD